VRDLTVENHGSGLLNVAVLLPASHASADLVDVTAKVWSDSLGGAYAIYVDGHFTLLRATNVEASASSNGSSYGLYCDADAILQGGSFRARSGSQVYGAYQQGGELEATDVEFAARSGSNNNFAFYSSGFRAQLHGVRIYAKGGGNTWGVYNTDGARFEAQNSKIYSEGRLLVVAPSDHVRGLENRGGSMATLLGGEYGAYGGETSTRAIYNHDADSQLEAIGVVVEGGAPETYDYVYGLFNANGAEAILRGGRYSAVGGERTRGIISEHPNTTLNAHGIVVEGRDGTVENFGLFTNGPSMAGV
jgi:hypothetical protein